MMILNFQHNTRKIPMDSKVKAMLRNDFFSFAKKALLEQDGTKLSDDPYLEYLAAELTEFADGETRRLLINLPPRHIKTLLSAVCLSAWILAHRPTTKIMVITYAEQLAKNIARGIRAILQSKWFRE